jgi:hypothetical protein
LEWGRRFQRTTIRNAIRDQKNFIAVGTGGIFRSTDDGQVWNYVFIPPAPAPSSTIDLYAITYNGYVYIAAGADGIILSSNDSLSWTIRTSGTTSTITSLIWTGSVFIAAGHGGTILTSPDGITWTTRTSFSSNDIVDIAWNGNLFVAVTTAASGGVIGTSLDGINWTARSTGGLFQQFAITWGNGLFVIVGGNITPGMRAGISTSPDGITWTSNTTQLGVGQYKEVIWTGEFFFAINISGQAIGRIMRSSDGINWTAISPTGLVLEEYSTLLWVSRRLVSTGSAITWTDPMYLLFGSTIQVSNNIFNWTSRSSNRATLNSIAWSGTRFVAVGDNNGTIVTSENLGTWTVRSTSTLHVYLEVIWAGNIFITVGVPNQAGGIAPISWSTDGITWFGISSGTTNTLHSIAGSGSIYAAVGNNGTILTNSLAGIQNNATWTGRSSGTSNPLIKVIWTGSQFIAVGGAGTALTSPDGITWTARSTGLNSTTTLNSIAWSGSIFVAVGTDSSTGLSVVITSADAITWTVRTAPTTRLFSEVIWVGNRFVVVGSDSVFNTSLIITSSDGITWTQVSTSQQRLFGLVATPNRVIAVGFLGAVSTSPPLGYITH